MQTKKGSTRKEEIVMDLGEDLCARYALSLPVRYESEERDGVSGQGRTTAVSSKAVRFSCNQNLRVGTRLRLELAWPAMLPDGTKLNLWIFGKVTRTQLLEAEVEVARYEFRTRRTPQPLRAPSRETLARRAGA